jgi:hypothetical protein
LTVSWHLWYIYAMGEIHLKIPDELRDQFKALCALKRSTMQEQLLGFIEKEVEKGRPKK